MTFNKSDLTGFVFQDFFSNLLIKTIKDGGIKLYFKQDLKKTLDKTDLKILANQLYLRRAEEPSYQIFKYIDSVNWDSLKEKSGYLIYQSYPFLDMTDNYSIGERINFLLSENSFIIESKALGCNYCLNFKDTVPIFWLNFKDVMECYSTNEKFLLKNSIFNRQLLNLNDFKYGNHVVSLIDPEIRVFSIYKVFVVLSCKTGKYYDSTNVSKLNSKLYNLAVNNQIKAYRNDSFESFYTAETLRQTGSMYAQMKDSDIIQADIIIPFNDSALDHTNNIALSIQMNENPDIYQLNCSIKGYSIRFHLKSRLFDLGIQDMSWFKIEDLQKVLDQSEMSILLGSAQKEILSRFKNKP